MSFLQKPNNIYDENSIVTPKEPIKKYNWEDDFDSLFTFTEKPVVEKKVEVWEDTVQVFEGEIWEDMNQTGFTVNKISMIVDEPIVEEIPEPPLVEKIMVPIVKEVSEPSPVVEEKPPPIVEEIHTPLIEEIHTPLIEEIHKPIIEEIHKPIIENSGGVSTKSVDEAIKRREDKKLPNWGKPEGWNKSKKQPLFQRPDNWGSPPIPEPIVQKSEKSKKTNFFKMLYLGLTDQYMVEVKDQHRYDNFMTHLKTVFISILFVIIIFLLFIKVNIFPDSNVEHKNDDIFNRAINYIVEKFFKK